ncbi:translation initiation factor IF-2 [Staphylospora marina]|uniref:translation initiation factor IF-2 n=1 Tax=Staphylospora marina TaxID=2490858 RepID=UPI001F14C46B|nr:translation initiation factor IF-2 [Staphylospora marina]
MSSKEILTILDRMGVKVNNHMSVMDEGMIKKVEQFVKQVRENASAGDTGNTREEQREQKKGQEKKKSRPQGRRGGRSGQGQRQNREGAAQGTVQTEKTGQGSSQAQGRSARPKRDETRRPAPRVAENLKPEREDIEDLNETRLDKNKKSDQRKGKFNKFRDDAKGNKFGKGKGKKKGDRRQEPREKQAPVLPKEITVTGPMTVGEFAKLLRREASAVIKKLITHGVMATINQEIDVETMSVIAEEFQVVLNYKEEVDESNFEEQVETDAPEDLVERPPVVTIMGHVDHGKTTLLDKIRQTNVTAGEAGGITQHIGAYQVEVNGKKITFLDTPGHEAFTTMRARGAQATDITVLVVAADDGVMPQTVEAINHAKAAKVPIIVAVNKMDKLEANPDRVKQQLMEYELVPEEWGGETIFVPVSALTGQGIDELLEMILLQAEILELKANPNKRARGVVIEAEVDKGRGAVATVLVQNGTLKVGDGIVAGNYFGKIRAMVNDRGRRVKAAPPSMPVEILGLPDVPNPGDQFMVFEDEKKGRAIAEKRLARAREAERKAQGRVSLMDLGDWIKQGQMKELNVIIKADVQGSAEALRMALEKIDVEGVRVRIIHAAVGAINESDVTLASASNAIIIGFNVRPDSHARTTAEQEKVEIRLHRVIYDVIQEIESAMKGMLDPELEEKVVGMAEVRQIFKVSKVGTIAGCYVTEGKVVRDGQVRLIRDGIVIHEGKLDTLKRFKDDVREVAQGYECGLTIQNYNDIKEGDMIEIFVIQEVERK